MIIEKIGSPTVIQSNPDSLHNYFGWPSIAELQDGTIAVVSSGFRLEHVCPFGKAVISYSFDGGESYTRPAPVIDTPLDDRDAGITPFGKTGVLVTSFNNTRAFQRSCSDAPYVRAYLDSVSDEAEKQYLGAEFCISTDCGKTFGKVRRSPITSPHGAAELSDGTILWVGRAFPTPDKPLPEEVRAYTVEPDGAMQYRGSIENIEVQGCPILSCEPHIVELPNGTILCHIRMEGGNEQTGGFFTTYQSVSTDGGYTWTKPVPLLAQKGGAPAHLFVHSSGAVVSVYGYREKPYGIRFMVSTDGGETWSTDHVLCDGFPNADLGYPASVELADGTILTVFYVHPAENEPAVIMQQKWQLIMG